MKPKEPQFNSRDKRYMLNQTAPKFGDRRTKRNRDRSTSRKRAIEASQED